MGHITQCDDNDMVVSTRGRREYVICANKTDANAVAKRVQNDPANKECLTWACKQHENVCIQSVREGMTCAATQWSVARKTKIVGFVFARSVPCHTAST